MAQHSGFFNALKIGDDYDRKYNSDDYCDNLATIIKNGVRYSSEDDLKVTAGASGLTVTVGKGRAWINGHWFYNDADFLGLSLSVAPTGSQSRIDRVVLRLNTDISARSMELAVLTGVASASPVAPALTRSGAIYELCLADIRVPAGVTTLSNSYITDQRANGSVCGWASSVTPAIMSMLQRYEWRKTLEDDTSSITFDIPQYRAEDVHILEVYTNGILEAEGSDYTIEGNEITFTGTKFAGSEIRVLLFISIDGTGLRSVADKVAALERDFSTISGVAEYSYICNGVDDNVRISNIVKAWLDGGTDYSSFKLSVYGNLGITAAYGGDGSSGLPYRWFDLGAVAAKNRKIIIDFSACSQIQIVCPDNSYNIIFNGLHVNIIGANVISTGGAQITMFSTAAATQVYAEKCRFWITSAAGYIARGGTFRDCRCSMTGTGANTYCFNVLSGGLLRLFGGEYYAYAPTANFSTIIYVNSAQKGAVVNTYSINCPQVARSGFVQTYAINCQTGDACCSFTDTITPLEITAAGQNIRGTIAQNLAGLM